MVEDRLGSKLETSGTSATSYYPYGELKTGTASQYATYLRNGTTGLDYAQQRWYSSQVMRFTSPDPYRASGGPAEPQGWNRYAYVQNDPVNMADPTGLYGCSGEYGTPCFDTTGTGIASRETYTDSYATLSPIAEESLRNIFGVSSLGLQSQAMALGVQRTEVAKHATTSGPSPLNIAIQNAKDSARTDLAKPTCYTLLGFDSALDAQTWFGRSWIFT